MQSVSSRIWTRVAVSISYDDNDYTTGTSASELIPLSTRFDAPSFITLVMMIRAIGYERKW